MLPLKEEVEGQRADGCCHIHIVYFLSFPFFPFFLFYFFFLGFGVSGSKLQRVDGAAVCAAGVGGCGAGDPAVPGASALRHLPGAACRRASDPLRSRLLLVRRGTGGGERLRHTREVDQAFGMDSLGDHRRQCFIATLCPQGRASCITCRCRRRAGTTARCASTLSTSVTCAAAASTRTPPCGPGARFFFFFFAEKQAAREEAKKLMSREL
jgi:hypothetical protein